MCVRFLVLAALMLPSVPALAQDHDHAHETSAGAITVVHPWARAAAAGGETMVFFEIENAGAAVALTSGKTEVAADVDLVGAMLASDGTAAYQPVGSVEIAAGDFALEPDGLGFRLTGLNAELVQGDDFELVVQFGNGDQLAIDVEIEAADAMQHSHAGHSH